jgi:AcrR family transcriptional regulator
MAKINKKLEQIIVSTAKLYTKYGIRSVTMDDVARELSLSKKTLYTYINDKNDLVEKVVLFLADKADISHCGDDKNMNSVEKHIFVYKKISKLLLEMNPSFEYDLKKYYPNQFKLLVKTRRSNMYDKMRADLNKGKEEGFFRKDIDVEKVVILNMIRIESLIDNELLEKYNFKPIDMLNEFFKYHLYAIATTKGITEYKRLLNNKTNE